MKERFQEKFDYRFYGNPKKIAVDPDEVLSFIESELTLRERAIIGIIKQWKNDGEGPTETDLVLENILKAISLLPPTSEDNIN